jgi:hypothetical protein
MAGLAEILHPGASVSNGFSPAVNYLLVKAFAGLRSEIDVIVRLHKINRFAFSTDIHKTAAEYDIIRKGNSRNLLVDGGF